jgi:hypothetical protein
MLAAEDSIVHRHLLHTCVVLSSELLAVLFAGLVRGQRVLNTGSPIKVRPAACFPN